MHAGICGRQFARYRSVNRWRRSLRSRRRNGWPLIFRTTGIQLKHQQVIAFGQQAEPFRFEFTIENSNRFSVRVLSAVET